MPVARHHHSLDEKTVCGGTHEGTEVPDEGIPADQDIVTPATQPTSCLTLTDDGTWETTTTLLLEQRWWHSSWASPSGLILMGGGKSKNTTEKINEDGTSSYSFPLEYNTHYACAINLGSSVILTGGQSPRTRVTEYNEAGFVRNLPDLLEGRETHGCGYYTDDDGTKTYIVTGGRSASSHQTSISSTELLVETASAWVFAGELPTPRHGLHGANIDNKIFITGGHSVFGFYDEILEFDPLTGEWLVVANMFQPKFYHAVSVVNFDAGLCVGS